METIMKNINIDLAMVGASTRLHGYLLNIAIYAKTGNKLRADENRLLARICLARLSKRGLLLATQERRYAMLINKPCFNTAKRLYLGRGFGAYGVGVSLPQ
jgi:hypothetical protein